MITKKDNAAIKKWMVISIIILWLWFELFCICRWFEMFIFFACIKEVIVLRFLLLGFNFDHVSGPKRETPSPCFYFCTAMTKPICDLALYLQNKAFIISWIYPGSIPFLVKHNIHNAVFCSVKSNGLHCVHYHRIQEKAQNFLRTSTREVGWGG